MQKTNNKIKHQVIKGVWSIFQDEEDCYKPAKAKGAFDKNYLEFEIHNDKYKYLSLALHFNENWPYFK